ncbi:MAG: polysaccharide deacetylase family protein [Egibacteraceae bacterium]
MTILCYHTVDERWRSPLAVPPVTFDAHCAWLARHRRPVDLVTAMEHLDASGRLPAGEVALTFDDGFSGVRDHAVPILRRHGIPATVFVVAGTLASGGREVDWVDTPPPYPLTTVTGTEVIELHRAGIGIGSHSYAHHDLTRLDEAECERDLRASRELLEDLLECPVPFLAYPRGRNDERVRRAARRAGYTHAFTLPEAREPVDRYGVPRVGVYPQNDVRALRVKTSRAYGPLRTSRAFPLLRRAVPKRSAHADR